MDIAVDVENSFKECLVSLMPVLVGRGQLVVKEVNGAKVTGKDLAQYFKVLSVRPYTDNRDARYEIFRFKIVKNFMKIWIFSIYFQDPFLKYFMKLSVFISR